MKSIGKVTYILLLASFLFHNHCTAQNAVATSDESEQASDPLTEEYEKLSKLLSNSVFEGHFTIDGKDGPPKKERYELKQVKRLFGDKWSFPCRIKYGDYDMTVPLVLPIRWADKTPVITVENLKIPLQKGVFNARVVISDGKYAGTWQHDNVGGHLYGKIIPAENKKEVSKGDASENDSLKPTDAAR